MGRAESALLNLSDLSVKRNLLTKIAAMSGLVEVTLKERKQTRSLNANSYYFVAVVQPFRDWLREIYGQPEIDLDQAHEMLKTRILGLDEKLIEGTGEVLRLIPRSKTLDTWEFSQYVEKCIAWLADFCNILVLDPEMFYEQKEPKRPLREQLEGSIEMAKQRKNA